MEGRKCGKINYQVEEKGKKKLSGGGGEAESKRTLLSICLYLLS